MQMKSSALRAEEPPLQSGSCVWACTDLGTANLAHCLYMKSMQNQSTNQIFFSSQSMRECRHAVCPNGLGGVTAVSSL